MGKVTKTDILMSKINQENLKKSLVYIRENRKARNFVECCDLQVMLRDYNPEKEKRFNSAVVLPHQCRAHQKVCVIGNVNHFDQCKKAGITCIDMEGVKKFNKQAKPIKKWARTFDYILVSESLNKQVAAQMGKILSSVHKLPLMLMDAEKVTDKLKELQMSVRWRIKKVPWLGQGVAVDTLSDDEIRQNINKSLNFLVSMLPKGWQSIKTVHIKFSMGKPSRIF